MEVIAIADMDEFLVTGEQLLEVLERIRNERPELLKLGVVMDARDNQNNGEPRVRGLAEAWNGVVFTLDSDESGYGQAVLIFEAMFLPSLLKKSQQ